MGRGQLTGEVGRVVKWGYLLQKKGINALEQEAERVGKDEPFLGWAMEVIITGYDGEETAEMLHNAIDNAYVPFKSRCSFAIYDGSVLND